MITKVLDFIKENHMLQSGDRLAVGVSGGADSVCLLFMLLQIREQIPLELTAVHVNHRIRKEAQEDAAYVEKLCHEWGCDYRYAEADVAGYAQRAHISTEEAGRLIRYQVFEQVLDEMGAPKGKIAVAHNQNDNAETVLFHLMRGSGLEGLSGIRPVRGRVIRPLLCLSREEIEAFLAKRKIAYCIDRTNQEDTYTRNRIRHHILPYAEKEICERTVSHIYDTSVIAGEAVQYIRENAEKAMERCIIKRTMEEHTEGSRREAEKTLQEMAQGDGLSFDVAAFQKEAALIQKQLLLLALEGAAGSRKDIGAVHVRALKALFDRDGNGQCDLPYGLSAYREYDRVRILAKKAAVKPALSEALPVPGKIALADGRMLECRIFPYEKSQIIPQKTYTKWFDYDKIVKALVLRTRQSGDYLQISKDGGCKKLKSYLIDEKIPRTERDELLLVADGGHILWVIGRRISEHYKINEKTKTVLQIQMTGGTSDGRENQGTVDGAGGRCQDSGDRRAH